MSTIHLHQTTTSTPEQYVAGLTDFGPGRSEADVTEGSGASGHTYTFMRQPNGTTDIDVVASEH